MCVRNFKALPQMCTIWVPLRGAWKGERFPSSLWTLSRCPGAVWEATPSRVALVQVRLPSPWAPQALSPAGSGPGSEDLRQRPVLKRQPGEGHMSQSCVPHGALPAALAGRLPPHSPSEHFASVHEAPVALTVSWLRDCCPSPNRPVFPHPLHLTK